MQIGVPDHAPDEHKKIVELINSGMRVQELFRASFTFYQLELQERIQRSGNLRVQGGLFQGLELNPQSLSSQFLPKWLGTYELEVQQILERHGQQCDSFLDIGCAEGFYLAGIARWRGIPCAGVDIDPRAKQAVEDSAAKNNLGSLAKFYSHTHEAIPQLHGNLLTLIDVDSNELSVLPELQRHLVQNTKISSCRLIIESDLTKDREHNTPEIIAFLCQHNWQVVEIAKQQPHLRFTSRFAEHSLLEQVALAGEGRHGGQCWIHALWTRTHA